MQLFDEPKAISLLRELRGDRPYPLPVYGLYDASGRLRDWCVKTTRSLRAKQAMFAKHDDIALTIRLVDVEAVCAR